MIITVIILEASVICYLLLDLVRINRFNRKIARQIKEKYKYHETAGHEKRD